MDIVTAAFGLNTFDPSGADNDCVNDGSEVGELACDWQAVSKTASKAWQAETLDIEWVSKISNVSSPSIDILIYLPCANFDSGCAKLRVS